MAGSDRDLLNLSPDPQADEIARLRNCLKRCRTVLDNMAMEKTDAIFPYWRWVHPHRLLRKDAKNLLPEIDRCLSRDTR
jgi:hypothetical protein